MRKTIFAAGVAVLLGLLWAVPQARAATAGIKAADHGCGSQQGQPDYTSNGWSGWATDTNGFNPDCYSVYLNDLGLDQDFRIGVQMSDQDGCNGNPQKAGAQRLTPWASEGGGWSGWVSQTRGFDPDCARIYIETRPISGAKISKARIAMQVSDYTCTSQFGAVAETPWATPGGHNGGWSSGAVDGNAFDPDCVQVEVEAEIQLTGNVSVHVTSDDGTAVKGTWTVKNSGGAVIGSQSSPAQSGIYNNVPFGPYTVTPGSKAYDQFGKEYAPLLGVYPAENQNLGPASPPACPSGQTNPHSGCQAGECTLVAGCGPSSCVGCMGGGPGEGGPPPQAWKFLKDFFLTYLNVAHALIDFDRPPGENEDVITDPETGLSRPHYGCVANACQMIDTVGMNSCDSNAVCGGPSTPPPPPPDDATPPQPTAIDFELRYHAVVASAPTCAGPAVDPRVNTPVNFHATGGGTYTWTAIGSTKVSQTGSSENFTTSWTAPGEYEVKVSNGTAPDAFCRVKVRPGPPIDTCFDNPPDINVESNYPITWDITGPSEQHQTAPVFSKNYQSVAPGTYTFFPQQVSGLTYAYAPDSPGASQTLYCGETANFHLIYSPNIGDPRLACMANPSSVPANQNAIFSAWNAGPAYSWTASGGNPGSESDGDSDFSTKYSTQGVKTVTVTSKLQTASCTVQVTSACPGDETLVITPPSADIEVGATASFRALYDADGPNCPSGNQDVSAQASWGLTNPPVADPEAGGRFRGENPGYSLVRATHSGIAAEASLNVSGGFTCTVAPNNITVTQGDSFPGTVTCTSMDGFSGAISLTPTNLPPASDTTFAPQSASVPPNSVSQYRFFAGNTTPTGAYTMRVRAQSGAIVHEYDLRITVNPRPANVAVSLAADPDSGSGPVTSNLIATVSGSATGVIDYYFWWNCAYNGASLSAARNQCGDASGANGATVSATLANPGVVQATYATDGTYLPKVIVERGMNPQGGKYAATAASSVTVATAQHTECVAGSCQQVAGAGTNRCTAGAACVSPNHSVCAAGLCVNVSGPGTSECANDAQCGACTGPGCGSHLACGVNSCVVVSGPGPNLDGCATGGQACTPCQPGDTRPECTHAECVGATCARVSGPGPSRCGQDASCVPQNHGECVAGRCQNVAGPLPAGVTGCSNDLQCSSTCTAASCPTHLACGVTSCVIVSGPGPNTDGCTAIGQQCTCTGPNCAPAPTCTFTASPSLIKQGENSTLKWNCQPGIVECSVLNVSPAISGGRTGQGTVKPGESTRYTLSCDAGLYTATTTVNVGCIREIGPNGKPSGPCK